MNDAIKFEIEQACRALKIAGESHLADAVGQLLRAYNDQARRLKEISELCLKMEKSLLKMEEMFDKFYEK